MAGVVLVIVTILAIALYSDRANRAGVVSLSDDLLASVQRRITTQVASYLDPAVRATRLVRDAVEWNDFLDRSAALEAFAAGALRQIPQIDALYTGDAEGNFIMLRRGDPDGTVTTLINNSPGPRVVELIRRDPQGRVTRRDPDPNDNFDPRTRPWYQGALGATDVFFTGPYLFFTSREPGITAAIRYAEGSERVFGVDITLRALSDFLASLKIGRTGRAVIIDNTGHLVAAPKASSLLQEVDGQVLAARLDQLDDPVWGAVYDRFRIEGYGRRVIEVGGVRMISVASHLPIAGDNLSLLIAVPEEDFTGFVASNARTSLWLSLIVIALAAALATLLAIHGLRADRAARILLDRGESIERQRLAFANAAHDVDLFDQTREAPVQALTAALGNLADARRVSVWRLSDGGRLLYCEDAYERESSGHVAGVQVSRAELPQFFAALEKGEDIQAGNAADDQRTADFCRALMDPTGGGGIDVLPVRRADKVVGAIVLEDASRISDARDFAALFAGVLAIRLTDRAEDTSTSPVRPTSARPVDAGERHEDSDLVRLVGDGSAIGAEVFTSVAVMSIRFSDWATMATRNRDSASTIADCIAIALQQIAAAHDIPYMKLVGDRVVAAAGFTPNDTTALQRVADASIAARDRCLELFESSRRPRSFRIGISCGLAVGGNVGHEPRLFNLWGDAVRTSEIMADTGVGPGTIQVCGTTYRRLRDDFLFRPRGLYYLPGSGAMHTFVLGTRQ
jgi:class 3 adenylate cyclase